jgi:hypothetical protein
VPKALVSGKTPISVHVGLGRQGPVPIKVGVVTENPIFPPKQEVAGAGQTLAAPKAASPQPGSS